MSEYYRHSRYYLEPTPSPLARLAAAAFRLAIVAAVPLALAAIVSSVTGGALATVATALQGVAP